MYLSLKLINTLLCKKIYILKSKTLKIQCRYNYKPLLIVYTMLICQICIIIDNKKLSIQVFSIVPDIFVEIIVIKLKKDKICLNYFLYVTS